MEMNEVGSTVDKEGRGTAKKGQEEEARAREHRTNESTPKEHSGGDSGECRHGGGDHHTARVQDQTPSVIGSCDIRIDRANEEGGHRDIHDASAEIDHGVHHKEQEGRGKTERHKKEAKATDKH